MEEYWDIARAAVEADLSVGTLYRELSAGRLKYAKPRGRSLFRRADVEEWIRRRTEKAARPKLSPWRSGGVPCDRDGNPIGAPEIRIPDVADPTG